MKCCYFHQTQAIWRFVAKRWLTGKYTSNETFRWYVRSLMVLSLSPETRIKKVFDDHKNQTMVDDTDAHAVYSYFEDVWFGSFPVNLWCQNNASFRTNNVAESFHAALSRRILHHRPQFHLFARQIIQIINESKTRLEEERQHPKVRRLDGISTPLLRTTSEDLPLRVLSKRSRGQFMIHFMKSVIRGRVRM